MEKASPVRTPGHVERVGLFGGSFDPVHVGHLILAEDALEQLRLDRIIFIPAGVSPHKTKNPPKATSQDRLSMVRLAVDGNPRFGVDGREILREGPSYAIDTVQSLLSEHPGTRFVYLIGADNIRELNTWHRIGELRDLVDFAVLGRGDDQSSGFPFVKRRIDISSTEIRERLVKGLPVGYFLPAPVHGHILSRRLYATDARP
jgi:nicotinate-nucleotide adenylyltransferase